jgi:hypothetical protein
VLIKRVQQHQVAWTTHRVQVTMRRRSTTQPPECRKYWFWDGIFIFKVWKFLKSFHNSKKFFTQNCQFSSSSSTSGSSTFITEPYAYREYFDAQGYIPSRTTIYSEAETPTSIGYEARYVTASHPKATSIYAKTVTSAAGLTVDLPSPDSGIGAESITPRDQTNIQQVITKTHFFH